MKASFKLFGNINRAHNASYQRYTVSLMITALVMIIGFSMVACDNLGGDSNPFVGNWSGTFNHYDYGNRVPITVNVTGSEWNMRCPSLGWYESGTYSWSGNTATFRDYYGEYTGTATISGNKIIYVGTGYLAGVSAELTRQ